jgi:hypothetical protein
MKTCLLFCLLIACASWLPAAAQSTTTNSSATATPITVGQRQAADKLLSLIYSEDSFNQIIEQLLQTQIKAHAEVKPYENEMRAFFRKYMSWSVLKPDMVAIYAQEFTETELHDIIRYYEPPTGRKAAAKMPVLMQKGMELGQRRVQEHLPELQKALREKVTD